MALSKEPMRNRFDYLSRRIGKDALAASGAVVAGDPINTETQYTDLRHEPDPARHAERARLGLLGTTRGHPLPDRGLQPSPRAEDVRACLLCRARHNRHCRLPGYAA